jgi:small subunit ribosomal protein S2
MKQMLETGVHFGHQTRRWNPKMRPYIFGSRNGIHIIDLQQTVKLFKKAHDFVADVVAGGGKVIFVGTKRQAQESVSNEAARAGQFYVTHRWMGGMLTNFQTIKRSIDRLKMLEGWFEDGTINKFPKKEVVYMGREVAKLNSALGGIKDMESLPEAAFIVDPKREQIAIMECRKLGIPVVAITDTNCDPDLIDYIIPGNDDAIRAIKLFVSHIADACIEGEARSKEQDAVKAQEQAAEAPTAAEPAEAGEKPVPGPETEPVAPSADVAPADATPAEAEETPVSE